MSSRLLRLVVFALLALVGAAVLAQTSEVPAAASAASAAGDATVAPAAGGTATPAPPEASSAAMAAPEPKPDDTNAQRQRSQPYNNAPFWRGVRESGHEAGYTSLPGIEKGVLIQRFVQYPGSRFTTAGEAWREVRNRWILPYGGALLLIVLLALALFYKAKGPIVVHGAPTGRVIERFTYFERAAHWVNAIAFVLLAVSGLVMAFGKWLLLPLIGGTLFGWLTWALKTLHNFVGPLFAVSLVVLIAVFLRDNLPKREDWTWLRKGGGLFSGAHVPSHRFNAGEKIVFWGGVLLLGLIVVGSGLVLDKLIPGLAYTRGDMQVAHMVHAVATVLMMAMFLGHIYLGTIGMTGAYRSMRDGYVDEAWAREHHELWHDAIQEGRIPAQRSAPAGAARGPIASA